MGRRSGRSEHQLPYQHESFLSSYRGRQNNISLLKSHKNNWNHLRRWTKSRSNHQRLFRLGLGRGPCHQKVNLWIYLYAQRWANQLVFETSINGRALVNGSRVCGTDVSGQRGYMAETLVDGAGPAPSHQSVPKSKLLKGVPGQPKSRPTLETKRRKDMTWSLTTPW